MRCEVRTGGLARSGGEEEDEGPHEYGGQLPQQRRGLKFVELGHLVSSREVNAKK